MLLWCVSALAAVNAPTNLRMRTGHGAEIKEDDGVNMSYTLDWDDPNNTPGTITKYRVYKSTDGVNYVNQGQNPNGETALNTSQSTVIATTNWFEVTAWIGTDESAPSSVCIIYGSAPPSSPMFAHSTNGVVAIGWYNMSRCTSSNHIERATDTNFTSITSFWLDKGTNAYTDTGPFTLNQTYYYRVRSWNTNGESVWKWVNAVAPNQVPDPPYLLNAFTTATSTNGTVPTSVALSWYDLSITEDGYYVERQIGGGSWTAIHSLGAYDNFLGLNPALSFTDGPLPLGNVIHYRVYATNYAGISSYAKADILLPAAPTSPTSWTNWYVDQAATGAYTGTNWDNAWGDVNSINWALIKPGDFIWVSGGTYTNPLVVYASGLTNQPITIHTATNSGHNSKVYFTKLTSFGDYNWVTLNGAKSDAYVPRSYSQITNNINLDCTDPVGSAVYIGWPLGTKVLWMEAHHCATNNDATYYNGLTIYNDIGSSAIFCPVNHAPEASEFAYLWIHDNWAEGMQLNGQADHYGGVSVHNCLIENNGDNGIICAGGGDIYNNLVRWGLPLGHPDGLELNNSWHRVWNNTIYGFSTDSINLGFYQGVGGNIHIWNNAFLNDSQGPMSVAVEITGQSASAPNYSQTITNMVIANNSFYVACQPISIHFKDSTGLFVSNSVVKNNLIYNLAAGTAAGLGGSPSTGYTYTNSDFVFDHNILAGTGTQIAAFGQTFANAAAFNAVYGTANFDGSFPFYATNDLHLTNAVGHGEDLSGAYPLLTNDGEGVQRVGTWDAGAYQRGDYTPVLISDGLVMWLTFDTDFTNGTIPDFSGNMIDGFRVTGNTTNWPAYGTGTNGSRCGDFRFYLDGYGHYGRSGDFVAINSDPHIAALTNMTVSVWALYDLVTPPSGHSASEISPNETLLGGTATDSPGSWTLGRLYSLNTVFYYFDGADDAALIGFPDYTSDVINQPGLGTTNWHHYLVTCEGTNVIGYYDGAAFSTNAAVTNVWRVGGSYVPPSLEIATWGPSENWYPALGWTWSTNENAAPNNAWVSGKIDDMRIYNRALSSVEVSNLYSGIASGGGTPEPPTPPANQITIHADRLTVGTVHFGP